MLPAEVYTLQPLQQLLYRQKSLQACKDLGFRILARRPHSCQQLQEKFERRERYAPDVIQEALNRFQELVCLLLAGCGIHLASLYCCKHLVLLAVAWTDTRGCRSTSTMQSLPGCMRNQSAAPRFGLRLGSPWCAHAPVSWSTCCPPCLILWLKTYSPCASISQRCDAGTLRRWAGCGQDSPMCRPCPGSVSAKQTSAQA